MSEEDQPKPTESDSLQERMRRWGIGEWAALFTIIGVIALSSWGYQLVTRAHTYAHT